MRAADLAFPLTLLALGGVVGFGAHRWWPGAEEHDEEPATAPADLRATVTTAVATAGPIDVTLTALGVVRAGPDAEQALCAPASTAVQSVLVAAGQPVHKGDLLIRFAKAPLEAGVAAARGELAAATAERDAFAATGLQAQHDELAAAVAANEADLALAQQKVSNLEPLRQDGLVAERTLVEARADADRLRREHEVAALRLRTFDQSGAEQQRQRLQAAVAAAEQRLALATLGTDPEVRAPADGTITALTARPGDAPAAGTELGRILTTGARVLELAIAPAQSGDVQPGMAVVVTTAAGEHRGTVLAVPPRADAATGLMRAIVALDPADATPLPLDAAVRAAIVLRHLDAALLVPAAAVMRDGEHLVVMKVDKDGVAHRVEVQVQARRDAEQAVAGELAAGDTVVTSGAYNLPDGAHVVVAGAGDGAAHAEAGR